MLRARPTVGGLLACASPEHPIYSSLGAKLSSFACTLLPRHGPVAQVVHAPELALGPAADTRNQYTPP
jgi:hypothetical protein